VYTTANSELNPNPMDTSIDQHSSEPPAEIPVEDNREQPPQQLPEPPVEIKLAKSEE